MRTRRYCSVENCKSGRHADCEERKRLGLRSVSLFSIPKDPKLHTAWNKSLGQDFSKKDSVCEIHFSENDVRRDDKFLMPDGSTHVIHKIRYTLVKSAIPVFKSPFDQELNKECAIASEAQMDLSDLDVARNETISYCDNIQCVSTFVEKDEYYMMQQNIYGFKRSKKFEEFLSFSNIKEKQKEMPIIEYAEPYEDHCYIVKPYDECSEPINKKKKLNEEPLPYTFRLLSVRKYFVDHPLRESWSWVTGDEKIIFTQINGITKKIRCYAECNINLIFEVYTSDDYKIDKLTKSISSNQDIINNLIQVEHIRLCEGIGVNERRSKNCVRILDAHDGYKRHMPFERCLNCRKERKVIQNRLERQKLSKNECIMAKKINQLTKSITCYREKCVLYKKAMSDLKKHFARVQKIAKKSTFKISESDVKET